MMNLDTYNTARLLHEQSLPKRLERARRMHDAFDLPPERGPSLIARLSAWLTESPQTSAPEHRPEPAPGQLNLRTKPDGLQS